MASQVLHNDAVDAAADALWRHLHKPYSEKPTSWRDMDSIGQSEFGGAVEATISAYLETAALREGRVDALRPIQPWLLANLTLYPRDRSNQKSPLRGKFGCPCKFDPGDVSAWDSFVFLGEQVIAPGETKRVSIGFMTPPAATLFRLVQKFYLWSGGIIGEAAPVSGPYAEQPAA